MQESGDPGSDRIVLTWEGPLKLTSADRTAAEDQTAQTQPSQRVHVTASGPNVTLRDRQRDIACRELIYKREAEAVRILGAPGSPARVTDNRMGQLWGSEVQIDRGTGRAYAKGPDGRLVVFQRSAETDALPAANTPVESADAQVIELDIRFTDQVSVEFGETVVRRTDPVTGKVVQETKQVVRRADFSGDVNLTHGLDRIHCRRVEVDFALSETGKPSPKQARAFGDVVVSQGQRFISAHDRLIANLRTYEVERPPFDMAAARKIALEQGKDPDALDWPAIQADYESRRKIRSGLERLQAYGDVRVRDPEQELQIDCASLDCVFTEGQRIASGVVTPQSGEVAFVALGDFSIASPVPIPFDVLGQTMRVEGPGRMTFPTEQDVDGKRLEEPVLVSVKWRQHMAFDGPGNEAVFAGEVFIESNENNYSCDDMRVDFRDVTDEEGGESEEGATRWWIFSRLAERSSEHEGGEALYTLGARDGSSLGKEPVFIYATGHVKAQASNRYERTERLKNRVSISGPTMAIDLLQKYVLVDGAGDLLIEDYGRRRRGAQPAAYSDNELTTPFGGSVGNEPSQTYISWEGSMSYRYGANVAEFERNVSLSYLTGDKMKLAEQILEKRPAGGADGHQARLNCQVLTARFLRSRDDDQAGMGRLSGNEVDAFSAAGRVDFEDHPISAIAHEITYTRADDILRILGTDTDPAQLFVQNERFQSFKGPKFVWNRKTNRILAPGSSVRVH
jgi:lipopolysaccharide export system protein LptA